MLRRLHLCDIGKARRAQLLLLFATVVVTAFFGTSNVAAADPKRVPIVHLFSGTAAPFTVHSTAFETEVVDGNER